MTVDLMFSHVRLLSAMIVTGVGKINNNQKQQYTFKAFLKALILLQSTMSEGKEFHALTELIKNELKKAEVLAKDWTSCFS